MTVNNTTFRPLVLTIAALVLLGSPALLSPSAARASQAQALSQAAIPPAYTQMITTIASAQSYKLVSDSTGNGGLVMHMEPVQEGGAGSDAAVRQAVIGTIRTMS